MGRRTWHETRRPGFPAPCDQAVVGIRRSCPIVWGVNPTEALGLPRLQEELRRLEPLLTASVVTGDGFLDEVTTHLIAAGGKRLRPLLALATATGGRPGRHRRRPAWGRWRSSWSTWPRSTTTTSWTRRPSGATSRASTPASATWSPSWPATSSWPARPRSPPPSGTEIAALLADTLGRLCQGQVTEVRSAFQIDRSRGRLPRRHQGKTAALMATSCRIGALTGGLPARRGRRAHRLRALLRHGLPAPRRHPRRHGHRRGARKPAGQDLAEGIYTLPVLLALADPDAGPELRAAARPAARPARAGQGPRHRGGVHAASPTSVAAARALRRRRAGGHRRDQPGPICGRGSPGWRPSCSSDLPD